MKLPVKLRTRLFLSISALITIALLGLLLGLFSVMQMTYSQSTLIQRGFNAVQYSQKLRQNAGDQFMLLIDDQPHTEALARAHLRFQEILDQALQSEQEQHLREELQQAGLLYDAMQAAARATAPAGNTPYDLARDGAFTVAFERLRDHLRLQQDQVVENVIAAEARTSERSLLVAVLLGMTGLAVLIVGIVTANSIARRFGAPIDVLARAADEIGQGNYDVVLPVSPVMELAALSRRFGLMTEALRSYRSRNVNQLLSSEGRLQAVLDSIDDGLVILDTEGRIEHANPVAMRQLFWSSDPHGQLIGPLLPGHEVDQALRRVLAGQSLKEEPRDLEIGGHGETRLLAWAMTPVQLHESGSVGAVMVLRDVTKQRAFERVRSEFVLRASHELRTPITGLHMAFSLLRERLTLPPDGREQELVRTVDEEMRRLVQLIDDLLNFSRYQNGLQVLQCAPCDVPDMLEQARQRFAPEAEERGVALAVQTDELLPRLNLDSGQIDRVLDSLLSNALRHSEPGGTVQLQAQRQGDRVVISVQDQGQGIPFGQQARIFEPFVQIGRRKGGVGLGLALSREIVQLHNGTLGVRSLPGQGANFYMSLPA